MLFPLSTLVLAPLLIVQGRYVRRVTPRLPEPAGARSGSGGQGPELRVLIVGDSAATGVGVETQDQALSGQLYQALMPDFTVHWKLLAETGRTSSQVLEALAAEPEEGFDVAIVSVGVNDVTGRTSDRQWKHNLGQLTSRLTGRFGVRQVIFTSVPPMHLFPALPQPLRWYLGFRARQLNAYLEYHCRQEPACDYLAVPFPVSSELMASDGFHPGAQAYRLWGEHAAGVLKQRLNPQD